MRTSSDRAVERNRSRLDRMQQERLSKFEAGLKKLPDIEYDEIHGSSPDQLLNTFRNDSHAELKQIMSEAERRQPTPKEAQRGRSDEEDHN